MAPHTPFNLALFLGWLPLVAVLFRVIGPRRATLVAVLGGCILMVNLTIETPLPFRIQILKNTILGAGLLLGILLFDRRSLFNFRPRWYDAPMVAYAILPPLGLLSSGRTGAADALDMVLQNTLCWLVPYLAGRLYFGRDDGPRSVAVAVVAAGCCLVPVCLFETVMGPRWYLSGLVYGTRYQAGMVERLGGYRPEGFFNNGITLATWMALSSTVAFWLAVGRGGRLGRVPAWLPAAVLVITTIACRGVYGYINLGLGLAATLLTQSLRTRWVIVALALLCPAYMTLRVSGVWDARVLAGLADRAVPGKAQTVLTRLGSEDEVIGRVLGRNLVLGFGNHIWHPAEVGAAIDSYWPDGWWLRVFWEGGLLGLAAHLAALHLVPAGLALSIPRRRPHRADACSSAWCLALFTVIHLFDSLHNASEFMPTALIAGTLVGWAASRRPAPAPSSAARARTAEPEAFEGAVLVSLVPVTALACLLYIFGHARVDGMALVQLVGGLGAPLLFAAAGAAGAWASGRRSLSRLALGAFVFAALGVSFNLALHPHPRAAAVADILQGLALCFLSVAAVRRLFGANVWADSALALVPLALHLLLSPRLPTFPGSQYLFAGQGGASDLSLFPLFPWLTFAALGPRAVRESPYVNLGTAALFALAAGFLAWSDPHQAGFVKFPMNLPYALLSCSSVGLSFALSRVVSSSRGPVSLAADWLGRRWLIFFYVHFAVAEGLALTGLRSPWAVWALVGVLSLALTWMISLTLSPLSRHFCAPTPWAVLLVLLGSVAALSPSLPRPLTSALAGLIGLLFSAHLGALSVCLNRPFPAWSLPPLDDIPPPSRSNGPEPAFSFREPSPSASSLGPTLLRLVLLLLLLSAPEILSALTQPRPAPPIIPVNTPPARGLNPSDPVLH